MVDKSQIETMIANNLMEQKQAYLSRGRKFQETATADLTAMWIKQMNAWADLTPAYDRALMQDLAAELDIRGIAEPLDLVAPAWQKIVQRTEVAQKHLLANPTALQGFNKEIDAELARLIPKKTERN
jgi:hypothetical protein